MFIEQGCCQEVSSEDTVTPLNRSSSNLRCYMASVLSTPVIKR
jgi:hypothetical protein